MKALATSKQQSSNFPIINPFPIAVNLKSTKKKGKGERKNSTLATNQLPNIVMDSKYQIKNIEKKYESEQFNVFEQETRDSYPRSVKYNKKKAVDKTESRTVHNSMDFRNE